MICDKTTPVTNEFTLLNVNIGKKIRDARLSAGLSQRGLGAYLGITFQQIQKYEWATNRISASYLIKISNIVNKPINWFFEKEEHIESGDDAKQIYKISRAISKIKNKKFQKAFLSLLQEFELIALED